ncbi:hypothetical protein [Halorarum halobium]|uniref:hypothetical protein n=1 Tax=Halorarum halobium TaxID=3075121 RepID=UPI0028A7174F|nr:hypothetical protein [Halobaculum sp. XH14]
MNGKRVAAVAVVVLLVAVGAAAAFFVGVGPFAPSGDSEDLGEFPTGTPVESGGSGGAGGSGDGSGQSLPAYYFQVTDTETCGRTCRDVTVELTNNREETATGITVYVRMFAGNSTDSGDRIWQGKEDVGEMDAGATTTATKRVKLTYAEGYRVRQNDGWVTIRTTVRSEDVTLTFSERRQVA